MKEKIQLSIMLALVLTVFACQTEEAIPSEPPGMQRSIVNASDIPSITSALSSKLGLQNDTQAFTVNHGSVFGDLNIKWDKIMQLVDSVGNKTYTFAIEDEDGDFTTFYNLILKTDASGKVKRPFIMKYVMDDGFVPEFFGYKINRKLLWGGSKNLFE